MRVAIVSSCAVVVPPTAYSDTELLVAALPGLSSTAGHGVRVRDRRFPAARQAPVLHHAAPMALVSVALNNARAPMAWFNKDAIKRGAEKYELEAAIYAKRADDDR